MLEVALAVLLSLVISAIIVVARHWLRSGPVGPVRLLGQAEMPGPVHWPPSWLPPELAGLLAGLEPERSVVSYAPLPPMRVIGEPPGPRWPEPPREAGPVDRSGENLDVPGLPPWAVSARAVRSGPPIWRRDTAEMIAAARDPAVSRNELMRRFSIGASRATRLKDAHDPGWRSRSPAEPEAAQRLR